MVYKVLYVFGKTILIEALENRKVELSFGFLEFRKYLRVEFEENHFEVENREQHRNRIMECLSNHFKLSFHVVLNKFLETFDISSAETVEVHTVDFMLRLETDQYDIFLFILYLSNELS